MLEVIILGFVVVDREESTKSRPSLIPSSTARGRGGRNDCEGGGIIGLRGEEDKGDEEYAA